MAIITLTSDIGKKDFLPGAIKGRLLSISRSFNIVDISHSIAPFNYNETVYIIRNSYKHFPPHSWHILLVNLFDAPNMRLLLAFYEGQYFACPDNGLLPMIFDGMPEQVIAVKEKKETEHNVLSWIETVGHAIHALENGRSFNELGDEADDLVEKHNLKPLITPEFIEGRIIFIDHYENVITNITKADFDAVCKGRNFFIRFKADEIINRLSNNYAGVAEGNKLAFFNTAGYLEIAVNKGNAAGLFGLQPFETNTNPGFAKAKMFYQVVRVYFEN